MKRPIYYQLLYRKSILFSILIATMPISVHARKVLVGPLQEVELGPWFTGPLLAPSGHTMPFGHHNYEPYVFCTSYRTKYDKNWKPHPIPHLMNLIFEPTIQFGILPNTELDLAISGSYNNSQSQHDWRVNDIPFVLAFQLLMDGPKKWYPALKLRFSTNIPVGKYDRLDPRKRGTDVGGLGNWLPSIGLVGSRLFHFSGSYYLAWRFFFNYIIPPPMHVHGLSLYGGVPTINHIKGTRGTLYLGNIFQCDQGFEFSLTKNWVLALDIYYQHTNKNRFSGHSPLGTKPIIPSTEQFSLAPAIEYNFSANVGIIAGPWFTIAGRNALGFISWVFAINIYR